ncbi:MAG: hypothetical protein V4597_11500 [Pseudomonadota bacterium]
MVESEWLSSTEPQAMFGWLLRRKDHESFPKPSDRKLRLFAVACYQIRGHVLSLAEAMYANDGANIEHPAELARRWTDGEANRGPLTQEVKANLLREIIGNPWRPVISTPKCRCGQWDDAKDGAWPPRCKTCSGSMIPWLTPDILRLAETCYREAGEVCGRCKGTGRLFYFGEGQCGDCHGSGRVGGTLDPDRLAVLADALEWEGCTDVALLMHLRGMERCLGCIKLPDEKNHPPGMIFVGWGHGWQPCTKCGGSGWRPLRGPHVRGCHVVDLLTGRS